MRGRSEALHIAAALLLAAGIARTLLFVTHVPLYGYANNYDFIRISSWFSLWPDPRPAPFGFEPLAQHPEAPIRCYKIDPSIATEIRYPSSDLVFVWLGVTAARALSGLGIATSCEVDLRVIGLTRAACLLLLASLITLGFARRSARAGLASAAVVAFVLSDPALLLLYNTLYSEFACVFFAYAAAALLAYAVAFRSYSPRLIAALAVAFAGLGTSKTQYIGLPLVLVMLLLIAGIATIEDRRRMRSLAMVTSALTACSLGVLLLQQRLVSGEGYMWSMRMGAATDAFFGAFLPNATDPTDALARLGLPARCAPYIGKTWYDEGMQPPPCPEVASISRLQLARLVWHDPALAARLIAAAAPLLQPMVVRSYGQVEGERYAQADLRPAVGAIGFSRLLEGVPTALYVVLIGVTSLAGLLALIELALHGRSSSGEHLALPASVLIACVIELYSFSAALVGAGFIDLGRHSLVGQLAFLFLLGATPFQVARFLPAARRRGA